MEICGFFYGKNMACCGNCEKNKACESSIKHFKQNVDMKHVRNETHEGKQYMVVPVIMMVEGAHYNGGLVTQEEFLPQTWNGRPVTIGHPEKDGQHMSANDPEMESQFTVGKLYNATVEDGKLKAEAWIDIAKCNALGRSDVVKMLKDKSAELDVSTGYFCDSFEQNGEHNGKEYTEIHRNLKPDHLALLPDEEGACNFADGCGVRANKQGGLVMKVNEAFEVLAQHLKFKPKDKMEVNMDEEQKAELIAELVASEKSPFSNEDKAALEAMSEDTLKKMMDGYKDPEANAEDEEPEANEEEDKENAGYAEKTNALSDEDKAALNFARNQYREHKKSLVSKITANSTMREKQLADMSVAQLEVIANGLVSATPDYSGRGVANQRGDNGAKAEMIKAMKVQSLDDLIKAKNGGNA